jgi:nucleoside-diphosphate-sugar epimerase
MIYGGQQENNISRLLKLVNRFPIIPIPGGGRQTVQPIFIDDLVDCLDAALSTAWQGSNVLAVGGPPITWKKMALVCAETIGKKRLLVDIPLLPLGVMFTLLDKAGFKGFDPGMIWRFQEDTNVSLTDLFRVLGVNPRDFKAGLSAAISGWSA